MAHVLLVEDSPTCQMIVSKAVSGPELTLHWAKSVQEGHQYLTDKTGDIDLVLLDLGLPDGDGLTLLDSLQKDPAFREIPVLLLTSREDLASKVSAFSLGADDYLTKPIDPIELRARIDMRIKKMAQTKRGTELLKRAGLTIDIPLMRVTVKENSSDRQLDLTAKEFKILAFLVKNENKVYSRSDLIKSIWGDSTHIVERTVDSHICALRRKMGTLGEHIENIPGSGYRFIAK